MAFLISLGIGTLFGAAIYQILQRNVVRSAIGLILLGNALNLFLLAAGSSAGDVPAYTTFAGARPDALPQAFVLTAIVISMGSLAFILALLYILSARYKTGDLDALTALKN